MTQDQQSLPPDELNAQALVLPMLNCLDPSAPISAMTTFKVNGAQAGAFKEQAEALVKASERMPGVKVFVYHRHQPIRRDTEPPGVVEYMLYQEWDSVRAFRA